MQKNLIIAFTLVFVLTTVVACSKTDDKAIHENNVDIHHNSETIVENSNLQSSEIYGNSASDTSMGGAIFVEASSNSIDAQTSSSITNSESSSNEIVSEVSSSQDTNIITYKLNGQETTNEIFPIIEYDALVTIGNTGYERYGYSQSKAKFYTELINNVATELKGTSDVYSIIIPTSVGIVLPDEYKDKVAGGYMETSINKLYNLFSEDVKQVEIFDTLTQHKEEYLYFRTDHHWTARGAYYAYNEFCKTKGIEPHKITDYQMKEFKGFLGTFYKNSNNSANLGETPDMIEAFYPVSKNLNFVFTDRDGKSYKWAIIANGDDYNTAGKYNIFAASDNPYSVTKNPNITDGSSCVIIKESFGNCLIPFFTDHYQTVYEIDYRYWDGNIVDFAKENGVDDVIFANNISMTRSGVLVSKLAKILNHE